MSDKELVESLKLKSFNNKHYNYINEELQKSIDTIEKYVLFQAIARAEEYIYGNWIDVEEMLPEEASRYKKAKRISVLVTLDTGNVTTIQRRYDKYSDEWRWCRVSSEVIAWQPLPSPYKAGEKVE